MLFAQAQDAQAGAEAVLRMDPAFEDVGDDAGRIRAGLLCPVDQSQRREIAVQVFVDWVSKCAWNTHFKHFQA